MNIESIPKTFWHSLSIAVMAISGGFTYVGIKEGNFSVKASSLELATSNNDARSALIEEQSLTIEKKSKELSELEALYQSKLEEIKKAEELIESLASRANTLEPRNNPIQETALEILKDVSVDNEFEQKVLEKKNEYKRLSNQQLQQQQVQSRLQQVQQQIQQQQ